MTQIHITKFVMLKLENELAQEARKSGCLQKHKCTEIRSGFKILGTQ